MKYFRFTNLILFTGLLLTTSAVLAQKAGEDKKVFITNEATINSENLEYSPAFYENGIVFISSKPASKKYKIKDSRINKNIFSIFLARRSDDGTLAKPEPFSKGLATTVHEGPVTFDRTASTMFFTRNFVTEGRRKKAKDGTVKLAIFSAENVKDDWSNVKLLPFCDKESNAAHPSISIEGNLLYFSSDRPGGHGGMDIWVSRRLGDDWGEPINLGPQVNTEGEDIFPFIHADGTLYFASNAHSSTGGLDIFFTSRKGDSWTKPTNLGLPFNTENDDFGFIIDSNKKNGYFSSNKPNGQGDDDIYSFYITSDIDQLFNGDKPKEAFNLEVVVSDFETGEMLENATVVYTSLDELNLAAAFSNSANNNVTGANNELLLRIPISENSQNGVTDSWGKLPASIMTGKHVFIIQKPGYRSRRIIVDTEDGVNEIFVSLEKGKDEDFAAGSKVSVLIPPGSSIQPDGSIVGPDGELIAPAGSTRSLPAGSTISLDGTIIGPDGTIIAPAGSRISAEGTITGPDGIVYVNVNTEESFPTSIKEGTVFQLPNIYYNFNDAAIRPDAKIDLDALATFLNQYKDIEIELASHTDSRGDDRSNIKLSQRRAENVIQYLVAAGVAPARMTAKGYGETQLRNGCTDGKACSEEQHQYNRRTDVRITKISKEIPIKIVSDITPPTVIDPIDGKTNTVADVKVSEGGSTPEAYRVVAGVFSVFENAEGRVRKLIDLGYPQAQIINLGNSAKFTVLVADVNSEEEGKEIVRALKKEKINAFVKF
jgi:outer membrane protein OmpA-like peptidoglycan-associated protein